MKKNELTTLILTLTVPKDDAEEAKEVMADAALGGDFDAIYTTVEQETTAADAKCFNENFGD